MLASISTRLPHVSHFIPKFLQKSKDLALDGAHYVNVNTERRSSNGLSTQHWAQTPIPDILGQTAVLDVGNRMGRLLTVEVRLTYPKAITYLIKLMPQSGDCPTTLPLPEQHL